MALNPAEYLPALELLSKDQHFQHGKHPLPQYLGFASFVQAEPDMLSALIDFTAHSPDGIRDAVLEGLRLGSKAGKYVPGELVRFDAKPAGLTRMEEEGVPEYNLAIINDHITWPGDSKFKLRRLCRLYLKQSSLALTKEGRFTEDFVRPVMVRKVRVKMPEPENHRMLAPSLVGSPRVNDRNHRYFAEIILKGMTGPIDGVTYGGVMAPMESYDNEWISSVMTYVRRSWGNGGSPVKPDEIEKCVDGTSVATPLLL